MASVTNAVTNTSLVKFLTDNQNSFFAWIQNISSDHDTSLSRNNSEMQLPQKHSLTEEVIKNWLVFYLSKLLLVNHNEINTHLPLEYYGITSLEALRLTHAMEVWLGYRLSLELVYKYPTVEVLAQYLAKEVEYVCVS
ncbi:acyl carrier protein [Anabaena cylindrica FACHB-243]|nr:acyl carrier protein [Anabaena cylindrica FACHB-243]MBY5285107.1 acyl carrier protein [Anabaena sp. CCAP 1446/1C]MBY5308839.1 acyl carrier protein [Anabaena sp. CCAP 1446/1C]